MTDGVELFVTKTADFSDDLVYRYQLTRQWGEQPAVCWVMLNPSTADAYMDDPTIRRCIGFSRDWGWGGVCIVNCYALRSTDPHLLKTHPSPIGDRNVVAISDAIRSENTGLVVAAWGANPVPASMVNFIRGVSNAADKPLRCLGTTKSGAPRHPLYVRADQPLEDFRR